MNIVFFGTSSFGLPSLEAIVRSRHPLKAVVSTPNKPQGRHLKPQASPVKEWALGRKVAYFDFFKEQPAQTLLALKELGADVFVVISFGVILKKEALDLPRVMPVNVHASLLPKYRGASPMQAALLNEDTHTGVTVIKMVERLDAGDILLKKRIELEPRETIESLEKRLSELAAEATIEALDLLGKDRVPLTAQKENEVSHTKKIAKEDGKIDWRQNARKLDTKVRAYLGWPGTFFFVHGKRVQVSRSHPVLAYGDSNPGTVLEASEKNGILVASGERTALRLEELQLEGRKALPWKEFLHGFPLQAGEILE